MNKTANAIHKPIHQTLSFLTKATIVLTANTVPNVSNDAAIRLTIISSSNFILITNTIPTAMINAPINISYLKNLSFNSKKLEKIIVNPYANKTIAKAMLRTKLTLVSS